MGEEQAVGLSVLGEMRAARRRHFVEDLDVMELLYRAYVVIVFGTIGIGFLGGWIDEAPLDAAAIRWIDGHGAAALGVLVSLAVLVGARTGSRGGPLAIEAAEVQYVLLAPVDRGAVLRPMAVRQLWIAGLVGAAAGAAIGAFAFRRLPGSAAEWIGCLAMFGALLPVIFLGMAQLSSGCRLALRYATAIGLVLLGWTFLDILLGSTSSPASLLGAVGTLPLREDAIAAGAGAALALGLAVAGLQSMGGISLEAARSRARLVAELRFSAAVQDVRAVVLLRRQLAAEHPRRRPWIRLSATDPGRFPIARRGLHSFLRWPPGRIVRVAALGATAGAAAVLAWDGTKLLLVAPGLLLLVVALDLIEPLAQEVDHPTRSRLLPVSGRSLARRQLGVSALAMVPVLLIAIAIAALLGSASTALGVGAVTLFPAALVLTCSAALSATYDPYRNLLNPMVGYVENSVPVIAALCAGALPLSIAQVVEESGHGAVSGALPSAILLLVAAALMVAWLGRRTAGLGVERGP